MSLLIAANLVDRVYMCADTRLSRFKEKDGTVTIEPEHDNQLKIVHYRENIIVGCVGSPALGAFLLEKIKALEGSPVYIRELRTFLEEHDQELKAWIDEYQCSPPATSPRYVNCVLLFAGQDPRKPRKISKEKFRELTVAHQVNTQKEIDELFGGKPVEEFTQAELGRFTYEMSRTQMGMKHVVFEGLRNVEANPAADYLEIRVPDQLIFAVEINAGNAYSTPPREIITFKEFEWGETPVYGAGFDSSILPTTFFGSLDLSMTSGNEWQDLVPFVSKIREKFTEHLTIGGTITNMLLKEAGVHTITQTMARMDYPGGPAEMMVETKFVDNEIHHKHLGDWSRLIPFTEAKKTGAAQAMLVE